MASLNRLYGYMLIISAWTLAVLCIIFVTASHDVQRKTHFIAYRPDQDIPFESDHRHLPRMHNKGGMRENGGNTILEKMKLRGEDNQYTAGYHNVSWLTGSYHEGGKRPSTILHQLEFFSERKESVKALGPTCTGRHKYTDPRMKAYDLLKIERPTFLSKYKNPCWRERTGRTEAMQLLCVPFFFIIGQPKCGTSDLHFKLSRHPQIANKTVFSSLHWLARHRFATPFEGIFKEHVSRVTFHSFAKLFMKHTQRFILNYSTNLGENDYNPRVIGEASPSTFADNHYWEDLGGNEGCSEPRVVNPIYLYHLLPQAKVILTLRDPVSRLYSSYHYFEKHGTQAHFHQLAQEDVRIYSECFAQFPVRQCAYNNTLSRRSKLMTAKGLYSVFLKDWFQTFPRDQIYISLLEEFSREPERGLAKIFDFLEVSPLDGEQIKEIAALRRRNVGKRRRKNQEMLEKTREMLQVFYKPFNEELRQMLEESPNAL